MGTEHFLLDILIILAAAKLGAELAERFKLPAVLGELVAGVCVGAGVLGPLSHHIGIVRHLVIDGNAPILQIVAQFGAVMLLFVAGLESDLNDFRRLGLPALWVAFVGVTLTILFGYAAGLVLGLSTIPALFVAGALAATSVGITARTFSDLGRSNTTEARAVLGAAIADDVIGLIVLAVMAAMVGSEKLSAIGVVRTTVVAIVFLFGAVFLGLWLAPQILKIASRMKTNASLSTAALVFCLALATLAGTAAGLSPIIGAFAAGLILAQTEHKLHIEARLKPVAEVFIPVFFVIMGARMPVAVLNPATASGREVLMLAGVLTGVAMLTKIGAGLSTPYGRVNRLAVGFGMMPRGEVTLIFCGIGLTAHVLTQGLYSALLIVVMATSFVTPFLLKLALGRSPAGPTGVAAPPAPGAATLVSSPSAGEESLQAPAVTGSDDPRTQAAAHREEARAWTTAYRIGTRSIVRGGGRGGCSTM